MQINKQLLLVCSIALVLPSVSTLIYRRLWLEPAVAQASVSVPYTIQLRERIKYGPLDGDKPFRTSREVVIARRSDGARSETEVFSPGTSMQRQRRLIVLPDLRHIRAWDSVGLKTTGPPMTLDHIEKVQSGKPTAESNCMNNSLGQAVDLSYKFAGKEWIGNVLAIKKTIDRPHSLTSWFVPEYGCEQIQRKIEFKGCCTADKIDPNGPTSDSGELSLVSIKPGEPDSALFDLTNLVESPPGRANEAEMRKFGAEEKFIVDGKVSYKAADEAYWSVRDRAGVRPPQ